jgi:hypothetical protein
MAPDDDAGGEQVAVPLRVGQEPEVTGDTATQREEVGSTAKRRQECVAFGDEIVVFLTDFAA